MSLIHQPSRRHLLAASGALAIASCATSTGAAAPAPDVIFRGLELPSESIHSGVASPDGRQRLTLRLCRYPTLGKAWIWLHAQTPDGFFSHVDHLAACGADAAPQSDASVRYADLADTLVFEREGPVALPAAARATARLNAFRSTTSRFGTGPHPTAADIAFRPARAYSGLNPGRTEIFGMGRASLDIGGKMYVFEGPAQFHEQRQTTPRFTTPFAYITLWAEDAGATFLVTPRRGDGYLLEGTASHNATVLRLDPPGPARRTFAIRLSDGRTLEGETRLTAAYTLPIYGEPWRGHFLEARLGGRTFQGNINDYLSEQLPYPAQG